MAEPRPFAHAAVLALLAAHHQATTPGLPARQIAHATRLPEPEVDLALDALCTTTPALVRVHTTTGAYVATTTGLREDVQRRAAERAA